MDKDGERMTNEEAIYELETNVDYKTPAIKEACQMAIKALEQQEKTAAMTRYTDGLEEGIRCAMCTNPMANDRGCDGGCVVNESMYQNVLNVIKKQILEQEPCEDCISREEAIKWMENIKTLNHYYHPEDNDDETLVSEVISRLNKLPSVILPFVTLRETTGHCKDCKYFEYDSVAKVNGIPLIVAHEICSRWGDGCKTKEDGYCFLFEPQESEDKE